MGARACAARFVPRPLSRRGVPVLRQRHRRFVCGLHAAGRGRVSVLPRRRQAGVGAGRRLAGPGPVRHQGAFRLDRVGAAAGLLGVLAAAAGRRACAYAHGPDFSPCLHRLVELSDRSRREQHPGLRLMTPSHGYRRLPFAYATAFAVLYLVALQLDLALFTVYPSLGVLLLGTHHSRDVAAPSLGFLAPAMYWYGWTATAALGALIVALVAAVCPERWTRRLWPGWLWVVPVAAMAACVYLTMPWFRL